MNDANPTMEFLVEEVRRWLRREPPTEKISPDVDPALFIDIVRRNRLQPLMATRLSGRQSAPWEAALRQGELAYQASLIHAYRHLAAGTRLAAEMERAGIRCLALRGPFFGLNLYEDAGVRAFTDIDLLIPVARRRQALDVAHAAGYGVSGRLLPLRFFERHHLHWRLENPVDAVVCELHWALDHPYKPFAVDYDAIFDQSEIRATEGYRWREPQPGHLLIAAGMHAAKHCRVGRDYAESPGFLGHVIKAGWMTHWLDVLAILRKHGARLDWDVIIGEARAWGVEESLVTAMAGAARIMGASVPESVLGRLAAIPRPPAPGGERTRPLGQRRGIGRIAAMGGFRAECLRDAWAYVLAKDRGIRGNAAVRPMKRAVYAVGACVRLGIAAVETAGFFVAAMLRDRIATRDRSTD